jgi:hypothetical protein
MGRNHPRSGPGSGDRVGGRGDRLEYFRGSWNHPLPLPTTQCEDPLWVVGRGSGLVLHQPDQESL